MKDLIKKSTLLDVRTPEEFAEGHAPNAINIPLDQLPHHLESLKEKQPIVAYCRSGNRSGMAVSLFKQNGITDVYNGGGLDDVLSQLK